MTYPSTCTGYCFGSGFVHPPGEERGLISWTAAGNDLEKHVAVRLSWIRQHIPGVRIFRDIEISRPGFPSRNFHQEKKKRFVMP